MPTSTSPSASSTRSARRPSPDVSHYDVSNCPGAGGAGRRRPPLFVGSLDPRKGPAPVSPGRLRAATSTARPLGGRPHPQPGRLWFTQPTARPLPIAPLAIAPLAIARSRCVVRRAVVARRSVFLYRIWRPKVLYRNAERSRKDAECRGQNAQRGAGMWGVCARPGAPNGSVCTRRRTGLVGSARVRPGGRRAGLPEAPVSPRGRPRLC